VSRPVPIILNPIAGGGRLLRHRRRLEAAAARLGATLRWCETGHPGHAEEIARHEAEAGARMVLAFGGDGTYNEVARGLVGSSTSLGVLPGGTTSVLAYELGIRRDPCLALGQLLDGDDKAMRVGRTDHDDLMLLMLSAGPDALVLSRLGAVTKRLGGRVGVALQACIELVRAEMPRLRVTTDQRAHDGSWAIIGKSRCYAGPFHATPGADPFAEHLELVLLQSAGRWATCGFLLGIPAGRHVHRRDVLRRDSRRLRLEPDPAHARVPYQVDGDVKGFLPVEVWTDPKPLRVRVPPPLAGEMLTVKSETFATP